MGAGSSTQTRTPPRVRLEHLDQGGATDGQVLTFSTATGKYGPAAGGGIGGSGTVNTLPMFTPDGTTLGDSPVKRESATSISIGGNLVFDATGLTAARTFTFPDETGVVVTEAATQTLASKTLASPTITGLLTAAAGTFSGSVDVAGDFSVSGTFTTLVKETVLIDDNHLYLNDGYTLAVAQTGGLAVNYLPTATTDTINGVFVAGIASTSNPTVVTTGTAIFSASDIIQISDSTSNDGLYEVLSHVGTTLTIRGIGTVGRVEDFTQNQFEAEAGLGSITKVTVSVLRTGTDGVWESAAGSSTGLSFINFSSVGHTHSAADITSGVLPVPRGGTGLASYVIGDLIFASAATTLASLADVVTGQVLTSGGVGAAPIYSASPTLTTSVTVPLVIGSTSPSGTLTLRATSSGTDGSILFETDPTTEVGRFLPTGEFLVGATATVGNATALIREDQNAVTQVMCFNPSDGTLAFSRFQARVGTASVRVAEIGIRSATHPGSGVFVPGGMEVSTGTASQISIQALNAVPIVGITNSMERWRTLSSGEHLFGVAILKSSEFVRFSEGTSGSGGLTKVLIENAGASSASGSEYRVQNDTGTIGSFVIYSSNHATRANLTEVIGSDSLALRSSAANDSVFIKTGTAENIGIQVKDNAGTTEIGLYGGTPVAQGSSTGETVGFVAGVGTGVNDDSTFTGNVGSTAYRISDLVKHLKNLNAIAA